MAMIEYVTLIGTMVPPVSAELVEHTTAGNGLFVRARRDICSVAIQRSETDIPGLAHIDPGFELFVPKIPRTLLARVFERARQASVDAGSPIEYLCYLAWTGDEWEYLEPEQMATATSVRPVGSGLEDHARATVEIHSHHEMRATFSPTDDCDERTGFRLYGVVGRIFSDPEISLRVGCHGHFLPIATTELFGPKEPS